ncbi:transposase [Nocardia abscessus]|uniref:transposase n=1 Tax=Nocardia TaxID=1817 RepID=UPI002B4ABF31|nr:transposase [Nocardia abscessus]
MPLLPCGKKAGRPPKWTKRQLIHGIRWRVRCGTPLRDVSARYGCWQTIHGLFRRWQHAGVWALIWKIAAGVHRCHRPHRLAGECGLHHRAGASARGWGSSRR